MKKKRTCFLYCCIGWLLLRCVLWTIPPGPIPAELGELKDLRHLFLSRNKLTGAIPHALFNLTKIKSIHLNYNQLTGTPFCFLSCFQWSMIIQTRSHQILWLMSYIVCFDPVTSAAYVKFKQLNCLRSLGLSGNNGTPPPLSYLMCVQHEGEDLSSQIEELVRLYVVLTVFCLYRP